MKYRVLVASLFVLSSLVPFGVAWANNVHRVYPWLHGVGDGADNDHYVHSFNHNVNERRKDGLRVSVNYAQGDYYAINVANKRCSDCYHLHKSVDTDAINQPYGVRECKFYSYHRMPNIDWHAHSHHNYCG